MPRACVIVLDAVGVGELPDAADYGDAGSNTLGHVADAVGGLDLPHLRGLGLGNVLPLQGCEPVDAPPAVVGRLRTVSAGKDTTIGHWELMGIVTPEAMPTYPDGFPPEVLAAFEQATGRGVLGNVPASGTEIIERLGDEHVATGKWIVYTSADSVFQVAAHEDVVELEELYEACRQAREILHGPARRGPRDRAAVHRQPAATTAARPTATTSRWPRRGPTTSRACARRGSASTASARSPTSSPARTSTSPPPRGRTPRGSSSCAACSTRSTRGWSSPTWWRPT